MNEEKPFTTIEEVPNVFEIGNENKQAVLDEPNMQNEPNNYLRQSIKKRKDKRPANKVESEIQIFD